MKRTNYLPTLKNILTLLLSMISFLTNAQFTSVQNGKWTSPQTWSTNPNATAIPDSSSTVTINHTVEVSGYSNLSYCFDLVINATGVITTYMNNESKILYVKNSVTNYGIIRPLYGLNLTVKGNLTNIGSMHITGANDDNFHLMIYGNIHNYGSFRGLKSTIFKGIGTSNHIHHLRSWNDSIVFLGNATVSDQYGIVIIDSLFTLGATGLYLNGSKLSLPIPVYGKTNLRLAGAYLYGGLIEANDQIISTPSDNQGYFGYIYGYGSILNTIIKNVELQGNFAIGGYYNPNSDTDKVIFEGYCELHGQMRDWYTGSISYQSMNTVVIRGEFNNSGLIFDSTNDSNLGLKVLLNDSCNFINNGNLSQRCLSANGLAYFTTNDTLRLREFRSESENCHLYILSNFYLKGRLLTSYDGFNFSNGHIHLLNDKNFTIHNPSYTSIVSNVKIHANNAIVDLSYVKDNVELENARIKRLGIRTENNIGMLLTGNSTIIENGTIYNIWSNFGMLRVQGNLINFGTIKNNSAGSLSVILLNNAQHQGNEWSNYLTTLNGSSDQKITIPEPFTVAGQVGFDAMIEGSSFQWYKDNQVINGANSRILNFNTGLNSNHFGNYHCIVDGIFSRNIVLNSENISPIVILEEGFDEFFPPEGWQIISTNTSYTWLQGNSLDHNFNAIDPNSIYSALCPWVAQNQDEWLISKPFSLGEGNAYVEFYAGYSTQWLSGATLKLYISTENTKQWQQIWQATNDGQPWSWRSQSVNLADFIPNENIKLAWQYIGNDGDLVGIDQIKVYGIPYPTSVNDIASLANFKVYPSYPNPFTEQTTFVIETNEAKNVIVNITDISGISVHSTTIECPKKGIYRFTFKPGSKEIKHRIFLCTFITDDTKIVYKTIQH